MAIKRRSLRQLRAIFAALAKRGGAVKRKGRNKGVNFINNKRQPFKSAVAKQRKLNSVGRATRRVSKSPVTGFSGGVLVGSLAKGAEVRFAQGGSIETLKSRRRKNRKKIRNR